MEQKELKWAVLGTGVIANEMAQVLIKAGRKFYAAGSRTYGKTVSFAEKYGIGKVYNNIQDMFLDKDVDIIYIASPHNTHYQFMKEALINGKHILVEKSITLNSREFNEMAALAEEKGLIMAEAMTIWHMPLYKKLRDIAGNGELGKVQMVTVNFGSYKEYDMKNRFFNMELAGGALLDIGVYALSAVRSFMDIAPGMAASQWLPSPAGSDEQAAIILKNNDSQMAAVTLSMHSKQPKRAVISCINGYIEIMEFPRASKAVIVDAVTGSKREYTAGETDKALYYEVMDMEEAVKTGDKSVMKLSLSKDVMDIMTGLSKEWEMKYPGEKL